MHSKVPLKLTNRITDIVTGMSDGLTVPFALAAGLSAAVESTSVIITAGLIGTSIGAVAMGLSGYYTGKEEAAHYDQDVKDQYSALELVQRKEKRQVRNVFAEIGLSEETQNIIAAEEAIDKAKWKEFTSRFELLERPRPGQARDSGLTIGFAYALAGMIPLLPFFFLSQPLQSLKWSCAITIICLYTFGFIRAKLTGVKPWMGALKVTLIGALAALAAFLLAGRFK